MPRVARLLGVGTVHHVITRFVDRSWQLVGDQEREQYLARLALGMVRARWRLIGYALMSSHIHLLAVASDAPLAFWAKPVHVGMAQWLNRRFGRLGPVFAGRPYCEMVAPQAVPIVLAYLHNNPVRARVVARAADSSWTSHRAYLGLDSPTAALDVPYGLMLSGFGDHAAGRTDFSAWVDACANAKPEGVTPPAQVATLRSETRKRLGPCLELGTATRDARGATFAILAPASRSLPERTELDLQAVVRAVGIASDVNLEAHSVGRPRSLSRARRAALLLWSRSGQPRSIMARALGLCPAAASQLVDRTNPYDPELVRVLDKAMEVLAPPASSTRVWSPGYGRERK